MQRGHGPVHTKHVLILPHNEEGCSQHSQAYLGVFHYTLDAVKVRKVTNRFIGIVQHPLDSLQKENTT